MTAYFWKNICIKGHLCYRIVSTWLREEDNAFISSSLSLISIVVMKTITKSNLGWKEFIFSYRTRSLFITMDVSAGTWRQKPEKRP